MIGLLLLTILPALAAYLLVSMLNLKIKSSFFRIPFYWFIGQYLFTTLVFIFSLILIQYTSGVLFKAVITTLVITSLFILLYSKRIFSAVSPLVNRTFVARTLQPFNLFLILFCFLISYFFFIPHLSYQNNEIRRSPIYWDYHWQMSLVQNFVHGDNFPPENEAFAGIPANYHYFWMVNASMYQALGLNPVATINFTSIFQFFLLLILLIGIAVEFFGSRIPGFIAVLLTTTSSSLHFLDYLGKLKEDFYKSIMSIVTATKHPWIVSQVTQSPFGYNGTMYNMFYFLQERQLITGAIYLLVSMYLIYHRKQFSEKILLLTGALMGGYFLWHLHITIMVLCALMFVFIFDGDRKKTLYMLFGFSVVFLLHYLYFKGITNSPWFLNEIHNYPKLNFTYASKNGNSITVLAAFLWYIYSYGLKLILFPLGWYLVFLKNKKLAVLLAGIFLPTFIILNTLQFSPAFIHDNHKFQRPMNVIIDVTVAFIISYIFFNRKRLYAAPFGILLVVLLTFSGFIEIMPYINTYPKLVVAKYSSSIVDAVRANTDPKSVFVAADNDSVYLAGRKHFLANYLRGHDEKVLDAKKRKQTIYAVFAAKDLKRFCSLTRQYGIDYIEYNISKTTLPDYFSKDNYFGAVNDKKEKVVFVDVNKTCVNSE